MKKSVVIKMFLLMLVFTLCVGMMSSVFAATDDLEDIEDLTAPTNNTASNNTSANNTSTTANNTAKNNTSLSTNSISKNNTSLYNNTKANNLPKTGIADAFPTVLLVVVFGISAVYAYKKIQDYRSL